MEKEKQMRLQMGRWDCFLNYEENVWYAYIGYQIWKYGRVNDDKSIAV